MPSLAAFEPSTRAWFTSAFDAATPVQVAAWAAIGAGDHTLVIAPTGTISLLAGVTMQLRLEPFSVYPALLRA